MIESGVDLSLKRLLSHAELLAFLAVSKQDYKKYESLANELQDHDIPFDPEGFKKQYSPKKEGANDLYAFILDRLRGYYADKGVPATHFNAVAALQPASLYDFDRRLDAIGQFAALPEAEALAAANKRIGNILRKVEGEVSDAIDTAALVEPAETRLAEALLGVEAAANDALAERNYVTALKHLAQLRAPIDAFFDDVMVMAEDPRVRANRLALLKRIADRFLSVADISLLASG